MEQNWNCLDKTVRTRKKILKDTFGKSFEQFIKSLTAILLVPYHNSENP